MIETHNKCVNLSDGHFDDFLSSGNVSNLVMHYFYVINLLKSIKTTVDDLKNESR